MKPLPHILVADDEPTTLDLVKRLLEQRTRFLGTVSSGEDALVYLEQHQDVDLVLLDIMMPGLDGYEVLEIIKNNPVTATTQVIMLTATEDIAAKVKAFSLGASDFLTKPFAKDELIARIDTHYALKYSQAALAGSEQKYRSIIDHVNDLIVILKDFRCIFVNQAVEKILGYTKEEFLQLDLKSLFPADILPDLMARYERRMAGHNGVSVYPVEARHRAGHMVPIEISATSIEYEGEKTPLITARDITERRNAEETISALARFHSEAPNPILRVSAEGQVMHSNIAGLELLLNDGQDQVNYKIPKIWQGYIRQVLQAEQRLEVEYEANGRRYSCLFVPLTDQGYVNIYGNDITKRTHYEIALQQAHDELERRVASRTAALQQSNTTLKQVIAERKAAEAKILEFTQGLLTLQYASAAIASSLDLQYVLETVTREMVNLLKVEGCAISEWYAESNQITLLARHGPQTWWDESPLAHPDTIAHVVRTREYLRLTNTSEFRLKDNVKSLLIMPLIFQDHVVGVIEVAESRSERIFTNENVSLLQLLANQAASAIENARLYQQAQKEIAHRKEAEQALEKERAALARRVEERTAELSTANAQLARAARLKDEFLASMSHELRTPLNAILSMSEALQEEVYGQLNEKQQKALKNVEDSGRHLLSLINDILDLSKIEAGKLQLQPEPVSVENVCQASLLFIKQMAHKKRIKVLSTFDSSVTLITADERRLKQVLVNLLSNAVKFTPEGGTIGLEVIGDEAQQAVHFTVWDTGIGIPKDKMQNLFNPFVQLDSKLSRRYNGTGLGLALVRRMTEMHGGSVGLESEENKGSRFRVSLPWLESYREPVEAAHLTTLRPMLHRVLIVEDSPVAAEQYIRYLKELNLEPVICSEGGQIIQKVQTIAPDLIILDILLPDYSGWDILEELKKNPKTAAIPVLIVSVIDERDTALALGAAEYLLKPISQQQLRDTLVRIGSASVTTESNPDSVTPTNGNQPKPAEIDNKPVILLAEDHEINLNTLSDFLKNQEYRVIAARNGIEAVDRAREMNPDLILMDIQMPEMDGLEAIQRIRTEPHLAAVPIIALTALAMPGDREQCLAAGANDYMSKPVSLKNLANVIKNKLNHEDQ